jgi:hypothetical protein
MQLARVTERRNAVMFDSRKDRRADENLSARITLALRLAHARRESSAFRAEACQSLVERANPIVGSCRVRHRFLLAGLEPKAPQGRPGI